MATQWAAALEREKRAVRNRGGISLNGPSWWEEAEMLIGEQVESKVWWHEWDRTAYQIHHHHDPIIFTYHFL